MSTKKKIAVLPGDGIGVEVTASAVAVLTAACDAAGIELQLDEYPFGTDCYHANGTAFPDVTREGCLAADAVLLGAVGSANPVNHDELGLLDLRKALGLYANIRPITPFAELSEATPFRPEILDGVDFVIVRELAEGLYFGDHAGDDQRATDECFYTRGAIERIARAAGTMARERGVKVTSVDKVNVLSTSKLWRATFTEVFAADFPDVELEHMLVDAMAMISIQRPASLGVVATSNMFGDILSDECSVLAGGLGMLPSGSFGEPGPSFYEPVHGSAPDIAGQGVANPIGAILSAAMLAEHSLGSIEVSQAIVEGVRAALASGLRTRDIAGGGGQVVGTEAFTQAVLEQLTAARA